MLLMLRRISTPRYQFSAAMFGAKLLSGAATNAVSPLMDTFGRFHNYLRISLTEKCNFRCVYCMPLDGVKLTPSDQLLTTEETMRIITVFAAHGVNKIRFTGGEPTINKELARVIQHARSIPMVKSVGITSNGLVLKSQLDRLVEAGLTHVNISMDTLDADKFASIVRRDRKSLAKVMSAVYAALGRGLSVKLNCVVMRGLNDNEVASFVELTRELPLDVRFIELMPFDDNNWDASKMVPYFEILDSLADKGYLIGKDDKSLRDPHDTTKWYRVFRSPASPPEPFPFPATENREGDEWRSDVALVDRTISSTVVHPEAAADGAMSYSGRVGFITSMSSHFCAGCNRLRVTADGKVKVCLFGADELDLLSSIRSGLSDEELVDFIGEAVRRKKQALGGHGTPAAIAVTQNRPMILIGG